MPATTTISESPKKEDILTTYRQIAPLISTFGAIEGGVIASCASFAPCKLAVDTMVHMSVRASVLHYTGQSFVSTLSANALATSLITSGHGPIIAGTVLATGAITAAVTIVGTFKGAELVYEMATKKDTTLTAGSKKRIVEEPGQAPTFTYNSDKYSNEKLITLLQLENLLDTYSPTSRISSFTFGFFQNDSYEVAELKRLVEHIKQENNTKSLNISPSNCEVSLGFLAEVIEKQYGNLYGARLNRIDALRNFNYSKVNNSSQDTDRIVRLIIQTAATNNPALMIKDAPCSPQEQTLTVNKR